MSLQAREVAKRFGDRDIFTSISFNVAAGEKVALLGRNGSGKSTLLRLLAGLEPPTSGSVHTTGSVALLEQRADLHGTVLDAVTPAALCAAARELRVAEQALGEPTPERLERYAQAEAHYRVSGGYDFETKAASVLVGLGLGADTETARLSGGEQRRVMLAALLLNPADILLLDEPTNHLDARSLSWLEGWLRGLGATVIVVSHDRTFLDAVVSRVLLLARGSVLDLPGSYTEAMALRAQQEEAQWRRFEAQACKKRALTAEMHELRAEGVRAGRFKRSRMKDNDKVKYKFWAQEASRSLAKRSSALETRLARLDVVEKPFVDTLTVQIPLPEMPLGPLRVLRTEALTISRNGRTLVSELDMQLRRGERWALLGDNGSGKSSLLAALRGALPFEGRAVLGEGSSLYWAGQQGEELEPFMTLEEALRDAQPAFKRQHLYHLLAQLGLPADPDFPLTGLSGGQRTRLTLARLSVTRAALLMLDEPTNHLDVEAITALETLLTHYPGTLLFTSHDRRFVRTVATHTLTVGSAETRAEAMMDTAIDDAYEFS